MSKHISVSEGKQTTNLENTKHENKIPDLEYLFRPNDGENKKGKKITRFVHEPNYKKRFLAHVVFMRHSYYM